MAHLCQKLLTVPPSPCFYAGTDDGDWDDETTDDAPQTDAENQELDFIELNVQLRLELGRRMTVALLDPPSGGGAAFDELLVRLAAYPEVRVLVVRSEHAHNGPALEVALAEALRDGADALLVWTDSAATMSDHNDSVCSPAEQWARLVLSVAEHLQIFDHCFMALIGEGISRAGARRLGFEEGFDSAAPVIELMRTLVRETLARETYCRRGSSPPCYL